MAILYKNFRASIVNSLPLLILYYLSISEIDTHFSNMFEILSFNLQIIIIYYLIYGAKRHHGPNHPCLILSWENGGNPTTHNQAKRPSLIKERQPAPNLGPHGAPIPPTQNCTPHGASPHRPIL